MSYYSLTLISRQIDQWKQERELQMSLENEEERIQNKRIEKETQIKELSKKSNPLAQSACLRGFRRHGYFLSPSLSILPFSLLLHRLTGILIKPLKLEYIYPG